MDLVSCVKCGLVYDAGIVKEISLTCTCGGLLMHNPTA